MLYTSTEAMKSSLHFPLLQTLSCQTKLAVEPLHSRNMALEHTNSHMCGPSQIDFLGGLVEAHGGSYSSLSFDCGKMSLT